MNAHLLTIWHSFPRTLVLLLGGLFTSRAPLWPSATVCKPRWHWVPPLIPHLWSANYLYGGPACSPDGCWISQPLGAADRFTFRVLLGYYFPSSLQQTEFGEEKCNLRLSILLCSQLWFFFFFLSKCGIYGTLVNLSLRDGCAQAVGPPHHH